jgi:hypothetical protein
MKTRAEVSLEARDQRRKLAGNDLIGDLWYQRDLEKQLEGQRFVQSFFGNQEVQHQLKEIYEPKNGPKHT